MSILSDQELIDRMQRGTLRIDPFREKNLTPYGYDLTIHEVYFKATGSKVTIGTAYLDPGDWCLVSTEETLMVPPDLIGQLWMRTSFIRKGLIGGFGLVDAGFKGNLTVSATNMGPERVGLPIRDRLCQIAFVRLTSPPRKLYDQRSGTYQGQRGITLEGGQRVR
jgi:dCTP deaminase